MTAPMMPQNAQQPQQPVQTALLPPVMPWTAFTPMPTDTEPSIAAIRQRRLGRMIDSAKFEGMPKEWQETAIMEYERMREVVSMAAQAAAGPVKPQPEAKPEAKPKGVAK